MRHGKTTISVLAIFLLVGVASAATSTWTGATDTDWATDSNWDTVTPTNVDTAVFAGAVPANEPDIGAAAAIRYVDIQSGGWTFSSDDGAGGYGNLNFNPVADHDAEIELNVTGAGLTVINANIRGATGYRGPDLWVGPSSKLVVDGDVINPTGRGWTPRGTGYLVLNGAASTRSDFSPAGDGSGNYGSYIFNTSTNVYVGANGAMSISSGNVIGGTVAELLVYQYTTMTIQSGGQLSPGGDGATVATDGYDGGALISDLLIRSSSSSIRAEVKLLDGAELVMDIGSTVGSNDKITIGSMSNDFDISAGAILALRAEGAVQDGTYTLMEETVAGSVINGTFGSVTFNGAPLDPSNYTLNYNNVGTGTGTVTVDLVGLIPEPATMGLLGIGGLALLRRRRK